MNIKIVEGDLLSQSVDVIVNSWNRNVIPWWLLLPQGVSGAIKKHGGNELFKEVSKWGPIPLGGAVMTNAGRLPFSFIIHVAGINMYWLATEYSVRTSVINAMKIVNQKNISSVAFPLIGSGSGSRGKEWSLSIMQETFKDINSEAEITIVKYSDRS